MIVWTDELVIGVEEIDAQHKSIVDKINELELALGDRMACANLDELLQFLRDYTNQHFRAEEALMDRIGYPGLAEQREHHDAFSDNVIFFEIDQKLQDPTVCRNILDFLKNWLVTHITSLDMRIGEHHRKWLAENRT